MMNLSNIKNPDEKIKEILKEAIKNKENKISKLNSDIDSLKKQHDDGTIFVPLQEEPQFNIIYVGNAITNIIGDILDGFGKGVELIKQDINKQTGGNTLSDKDKEFKERIKNNTNKLSDVINKAQNNVNNVNKSLNVGTKSLNDNYSKAKNNLKNNINKASEHVDNTLNNINKASEQVNKASQQVNNTLDNVNQASQQVNNTINNVNKSLDVHRNRNRNRNMNMNMNMNMNTNNTNNKNKELNDSYSKATELGEIAFKSGIKWAEDFINMMIDVTLDSTGKSHLADKSWHELSPELNKKLLLTAGLLKELSDNPATREAVKEIAKAIAITMVEIMKEIKPELDKITDQALEMLDEVSDKAVRGATKTGISVGQAVISEIPFWGGIIDLIIAIGKGFNAVAETYKVFVIKSSPMMIDAAKTYVNTEQTVEEGKDRISNAYDNAMNTLNNASNINSGINNGINSGINSGINNGNNNINQIKKNVTNNTNVMKGGVFIPDKNINNKILKGGNRLKKTMKLFHKTLPRVKYSYKNIFHKNNNFHKRNKTNKKKRNITRKKI